MKRCLLSEQQKLQTCDYPWVLSFVELVGFVNVFFNLFLGPWVSFLIHDCVLYIVTFGLPSLLFLSLWY